MTNPGILLIVAMPSWMRRATSGTAPGFACPCRIAAYIVCPFLSVVTSLCAPSPQFFAAHGGEPVRLPRCRHNPELLHQLQTTPVSPAFHNFAALEVIDVHTSP